ncbi:nitroreductase family protein [Aequorivita sp. SDUM287046]|uniref:Nitroreductase family protein n=1 Tax=Aequorivita aurantiaca TaxID=3053356 RepID=A0ABT8DEC8_9FLAO|nr:nitroreductase family protein [Aequorivita aurantiaca]MDN3723483.1 nitroreductase family protein [Aequorivita aurantiaca]
MENIISVQKITPVAHPILDSIKKRWSPRAFAQTPITENQLHIILEAGRWAPSASNIQPWRVLWGLKGTEMYDRIFNCLDDFNQSWAGNAQMLWINAFKKTMEKNEKENFHALHDLGLFMGNVIHQANSMGIAVHQMAGVKFKQALSEFKFSEDYHVATAVAFGYFGGDPDDLNEDLKKQELKQLRERKEQSTFAFNGNFENKK